MKMGEVASIEERVNEEKKEESSSIVRWEKFLARVSIRVLLVEADDSTRHIISALLRKCSYKVASVSDGLKAWELLKARPHSIDLILTEVELPSVSGYALLTLIMEHEICNNIPVIMMSPHDSVSTVYKCMLRGAADFLVKPIRTNELKNLWQHVWRRQSTCRPRVGLEEESAAQQNVEATAENNATTSDCSISSKSCSLGEDNSSQKGSDAQSSCGKLDLEADSDDMAEAENHLVPKLIVTSASGLKLTGHCNYVKSDQNFHGCEIAVAESNTAVRNDNDKLTRDGSVEQQKRGQYGNPCSEASNSRDVIDASSKAIDFMAALCDYPRLSSYLNDVANKFESSPHLDLSLRGFTIPNEKHMLNHSNASAFTRYVNKANATSLSSQKETTVNSDDNLCSNVPDSNTNPKKPSLQHDKAVLSCPLNLTKETENEYPTSSQRSLPIPFQARGTRVDVCSTSVSAGYRSTIPPITFTPSPSPSPSSINQQQNSFPQFSVDAIDGKHLNQLYDQCPRISSNQSTSKQDLKLGSLGDQTQLSPATDQSASSTLHHGNTGIFNVFGCVGNVLHQDAMVPDHSKSGNEQGQANHHELSRLERSIQREAALTKFRLKRKERCFEKKVRYESRKKLAEKRPRVKGQFVRQFPPYPLPPKPHNNTSGTPMGS